LTPEDDAGIPAGTLPVAARAPGKCILFGEHAIVYGKPELVLAIDLYTQLSIRAGGPGRLNGDAEAPRSHPYLRAALELEWADGPPLELNAVSRVPRAAGLGSSAAFVAALVAGLSSARGGLARARLAEEAFRVERTAQGVGSPGDTSASVGGGYLALNVDAGQPLWELRDAGRRWTVSRLPDPGWVWIVAYSGIPRDTATTVRTVGERLRAPDGPSLLSDLESVGRAGVRALLAEDREETGRQLDANQALLRRLGVSHPRLEELLDAVRPTALGAKLTGAGAGGSIVVLPAPGKEVEATRRLARAGAVAYAVRAAPRGAEIVPATPVSDRPSA
jgi:mevalonate kinase